MMMIKYHSLKQTYAIPSIPFRIEFVSEKSRLTSGKKRTINFENGSSNQEVVSTPGFLKNELLVAVGQGMPNTTKPRRDVQKPGRKMVQNNSRNRGNGKLRYNVIDLSIHARYPGSVRYRFSVRLSICEFDNPFPLNSQLIFALVARSERPRAA